MAEAGTLGREQLHGTLAPFAAPEELDALAAGLAEAGWVALQSRSFTILPPAIPMTPRAWAGQRRARFGP